MTVPIRYTTDDTRSAEQAQLDDQIREDVERTGGLWAQMTAEQREQTLARLRDKKQRAQAARVRKQGELEALEHRVARLEERVGRLEG
jgi:L-lactate utilization protein LutB